MVSTLPPEQSKCPFPGRCTTSQQLMQTILKQKQRLTFFTGKQPAGVKIHQPLAHAKVSELQAVHKNQGTKRGGGSALTCKTSAANVKTVSLSTSICPCWREREPVSWALGGSKLRSWGTVAAWHLSLRSNADHTIVCKGRGACRGASGIRGSHIVCV